MTLRKQCNQILKDEIDRFAAKMKDAIDNGEIVVQAHERMAAEFAAENDRLNREQSGNESS